MEIDALRQEINAIDTQLLHLLDKRFQQVRKIKDKKAEKSLQVEDKEREQTILHQLQRVKTESKLSPEFIERLWSVIFDEAKRTQQ